jgi:hypothetical protein
VRASQRGKHARTRETRILTSKGNTESKSIMNQPRRYAIAIIRWS